MNFNNIDNIKLTKDDYYNLFAWKDNNKDSVRNFNPILEEGAIIIENHIKQYFKQDGINIYFEIYFGNLLFFDMTCQRLDNGKTLLKDHNFNESVLSGMNYSANSAIEDAITLHASIMAYMEYFMENKIYINKEIVKKGSSNKKKRKDKSRANIVRIKQRIYNINIGSNTNEVTNKRKITRRADKWTVRGHWRQLKSGRKVWVKSYTKGNGNQVIPKTYVI